MNQLGRLYVNRACPQPFDEAPHEVSQVPRQEGKAGAAVTKSATTARLSTLLS